MMANFTSKQVPVGADPRRGHLDDREPLKRAAENARSRMISMLVDEEKQPKLKVDYQPAISSERCGRCENGIFEPGQSVGACRLVAGSIEEGAWCELFDRRQNLSKHMESEAALQAQPEGGTTSPGGTHPGSTSPSPSDR